MIEGDLKALTRDQALFAVAHELMRRLFEIEPNAVTIDVATGQGSVLATTDEGAFIASLLKTIEAIVEK